MSEHILEVKDLKQYFPINTGWFKKTMLKAVDGVSFSIDKGETLGLVGESGCGKTTVGRTILHLYNPTSGDVIYDGTKITPRNIEHYRKDMQIVFQDPYASLNPRMTVADIVGEPLDIHHLCKTKAERADRISELLTMVGLNSDHASRYAHQFSGGQRQRICIARALAVKPKFVVCDECVSALDVSIQSQIINLLQDLKEKENLTYMFISHDLSVVRYISDRICVMYLGNVVELADAETLFRDPRHPYTVALLSSIPTTDQESLSKERILLEGSIPSPIKPPSGCKFHTRCYMACEKCKRVPPELREVEPGHFLACHNPERKMDENGNYLFEMPKMERKSSRAVEQQ